MFLKPKMLRADSFTALLSSYGTQHDKNMLEGEFIPLGQHGLALKLSLSLLS